MTKKLVGGEGQGEGGEQRLEAKPPHDEDRSRDQSRVRSPELEPSQQDRGNSDEPPSREGSRDRSPEAVMDGGEWQEREEGQEEEEQEERPGQKQGAWFLGGWNFSVEDLRKECLEREMQDDGEKAGAAPSDDASLFYI